MRFVKAFWSEEEGQDMVEYALLLAFISLGAAGLLSSVYGSISNLFLSMYIKVANACSAAHAC